MHPSFRSLLPFTAVLITAASPLSAQTVEIKPQWPVGKKFYQSMQMDQTSTMAIGDQKMEQKVGMTMESTIAVKAHENGKFKRATLKYDRMVMDMNMAGQAMKYDSAKAADPASDPLGMGKTLGIMLGKDLKLVLDEKDDVLEVENLDAMLKEMAAANPMASMLGQVFSKDAMKNMMRQSSLYGTPGKPVKAGDSWPFTFSVTMAPLGKVSMNGTYTMKGIAEKGGAKCAELAITAKLAIDPTAPGADASPGASLQALGISAKDGTMTGTVWFDTAIGINREAQFTQQIDLKMKNPQKPDETMTIPMKQVMKQTLTKVENL